MAFIDKPHDECLRRDQFLVLESLAQPNRPKVRFCAQILSVGEKGATCRYITHAVPDKIMAGYFGYEDYRFIEEVSRFSQFQKLP